MKLHNPGSQIFIPDGAGVQSALERTTHLGIIAHQDDLEFNCVHGILDCYQQKNKGYCGVVVTDGRGSSRTGPFKDLSDEQMREVRWSEQKKAAVVGQYSAMISLDYPSKAIKEPKSPDLVSDLKTIIKATRPQFIFTHNPADKHDTHIAVLVGVIRALRELGSEHQPKAVYGCEAWRSLDWMTDNEKVIFDVSARENLTAALMGVFDSQITGGKRYDLATFGRKRANATYHESHASDKTALQEFYMDLTPLVKNPSLKISDYTEQRIQSFAADVKKRLGKFSE